MNLESYNISDSLKLLIPSIEIRRKHLKNLSALVIDDDPVSLQVACSYLQRKVEVYGAQSAEEAINYYILNTPRLTFIDLTLNNFDGFDLLKLFKEMDSAAYIIILSGGAHQENITRAIKMGAKGFIGKPFSEKELNRYIDKYRTEIGVDS